MLVAKRRSLVARVLPLVLWMACASLAMGIIPCWGRNLNWEILQIGYTLAPDEVVSKLGASALKAGVANASPCALLLPPMETTLRRREDPSWLLLSNSPEILDETSLPRKRAVLVSADVPMGNGRVLVSHANLHPLKQDLVLRITNKGEFPAEVVMEPRAVARQNVIPGAFRMDASVGGLLAQDFLRAVRAKPQLGWRPADGDRKRILRPRESSDARLVSEVRGLGMAWTTLNTNCPLSLTVFATPSDTAPEPSSPVATRTGSQVRGLFNLPDADVDATVDLSDARPHRYVFGEAERNNRLGVLDGGSWMNGTDGTVAGQSDAVTNRGDYGGLTWFHGTVKASSESGVVAALFVLLAGGRKAAVINPKDGRTVVLSQWSGLVVGRTRVGETFDMPFTLPPNSWAPVYLVAVPLYTR